ncbi:MAG TPA: NlpC/P60 family protein [Acidimicrobiales bacterium]|nr:NlpC/P60 family protein [Acidimicrobiales bacterium]
MVVDSIVPMPPGMSAIESMFSEVATASTALSPGASGSTGAPTDPFSVLLDAAAGSSSGQATTTASAGSSAGSTGAGSLSPLFSSLGPGASAATAAGASSAYTSAADTSAGGGQAIVADAERYLGVPYVWGGTSPQTGFDCSGLTQHVFGDLGVTIPRTSEEQAQVGTPVASLADAQPGDLLFFEPGQNGAPTGEPGHVAIYIGNGQMIAAPQTGQNVQIQAVPGEPYEIRRIAVPPAAASSAPTTAATTSAGPATAAVDGTALATTNASAPPTGATVSIGSVPVPSQYASLVNSAAAAAGVPPSLLASVLYTESRFQPSVVSSAGAQGIAQFMPSTAAAHGINPFDPTSAIPGAAQLLGQYHAAFGSWGLAVAAYGAGAGAVEQAGGIPQDGTTPNDVSTVLSLAGMSGTSPS